MKSLRARLAITLGLGLALLIGVGGVFLYLRVRDTLQEAFDDSLRDRAAALAANLEIDIKPAFRKQITSLGAKAFAGESTGADFEAIRAELLRLAEDGFEVRLAGTERRGVAYSRTERPEYFEIWLPDGSAVARSPSLGDAQLGPLHEHETSFVAAQVLPNGRAGRAALLRVEDVPFPREAWTRAWDQIRGSTPLQATRVYVRVAADVEEQASLLSSLRAGLLVAGILLILAVAGFVWFMTGRALAPLGRLRRQVEALEADSLDQRVTLDGVPTELALVVQSLNSSLERLERGFERERRTASHIAHELRTPIAELQSVTDVARQWPDDAELQARCVQQGHEIAAHMTRIVSALMRVARAGTTPALLSAELELGELVSSIWKRMDEPAEGREQRLEVAVPAGLSVQADPEVVETLLANLLRNAVDHAPVGSVIRCTARPSGERHVELTVSNPCTDLDAADMENITELFWRKDESRTTSLQAGLGLPLVTEVARSAGLGFALALEDGAFHARLRLPQA